MGKEDLSFVHDFPFIYQYRRPFVTLLSSSTVNALVKAMILKKLPLKVTLLRFVSPTEYEKS